MNALIAAALAATTSLTGPAVAGAAGAPTTPAPQPITWHACTLGPDDAEGQALDAAGVDCADVTVPLDYTRPRGRTLTVAVARSKAPDSAHRIGAMILNLGGPASPVLSVVPAARAVIGDAGARFDLIGMDPRFSGRSTPIDCHWPGSWLPRSAGADRESFERMVALSRDLARRCTDDRLRYAATANQARDMDTVRAGLGDAKLSYLGYSYGSYLGAVYTQLFPQRADRIVLDSAIDPSLVGTRQLRTTGPGRQAALAEWAAWAAARDSQYHLGTTTSAVLGTVDRAYAASARRPLALGSLRIDDTVLPAVIANLLADDTDNGDLAVTVGEFAKAAAGQPAQATDAVAEVASSVLTGDQSAVHSPQTAIQCADAAVPRDPQWYWRDIQAHRAGSPIFEPMARTITACAFTPAPIAPPVRVGNNVPALIVQAEKDINSQLPAGQAMHRTLTGSRMIVLAGARTHGVYGFRGSSCVDDQVGTYLSTGRLPAADLVCTES
jgi:pimeloyl-ACP methyl ester carboxylesterase